MGEGQGMERNLSCGLSWAGKLGIRDGVGEVWELELNSQNPKI